MKRSFIFLVLVLVLFVVNVGATNSPAVAITTSKNPTEIFSKLFRHRNSPKFVKGEIIVKYKDSANQFAQTIDAKVLSAMLVSNKNFSSIDRLKIKYHVKKQRALFRSEGYDQKIINKRGYIDVAFQKEQFFNEIVAIKQKYIKRSKRIPSGVASQKPDTSLQNIYVLEMEPNADIEAAVADFARNPNVEYAQPNYVYEGTSIRNSNPYYPQVWGLKKIKADKVWDASQGEGIVVAVVDTGVDYNHDDIKDNIWININEVPDNNIDDGPIDHPTQGNGYIDDWHGWNFVDNNNDPMDGYGHGTHVAGTIAAVNNNIGIIGVAPRAKIMALKAMADDGTGRSSNLLMAIRYAANNGADVINNSWGGDRVGRRDQAVIDVINYAYNLGVVVIFAAGNSSQNVDAFTPQNLKSVITVGALDSRDRKAEFSNYGFKIDTWAPGVSIASLNARHGNNYVREQIIRRYGQDYYNARLVTGDEDYIYYGGTSMAASHISGVVALILGNPITQHITNDQIKILLQATRNAAIPDESISLSLSGLVDLEAVFQVTNVPRVSIDSPANFALEDKTKNALLKITGSLSVCDNSSLSFTAFDQRPFNWKQISNHQGIIQNGNLGTLNLMGLESGRYLLRLTCDYNNKSFEDRGLFFNEENVTQISNHSSVRSTPAISGDIIAWEETQGGVDALEIWYFDLAHPELGERQLTNDSDVQYNPAISGRKIAWTDFSPGFIKAQINYYDLDRPVDGVQLLPVSPNGVAFQDNASFNDGRLVWLAEFPPYEGNPNWRQDIYLYDFNISDHNKREQVLTKGYEGSISRPMIFGNRVAWLGDSDGGGGGVFVRNISGDDKTIKKVLDGVVSFRLAENRIIFKKNGDLVGMYLYDFIKNTEQRLNFETSLTYGIVPRYQFDGNLIVCEDLANNGIRIYNINLKEEKQVAFRTYRPELADTLGSGGTGISGGKAVFVDPIASNIYMYIYGNNSDADKKVISAADTKIDGLIDTSEVVAFYPVFVDSVVGKAVYRASLDFDNNGKVGTSDLVRAKKVIKSFGQEWVLNVIALADRNSDARVSSNEVQALINKMGLMIQGKETVNLRYDFNGDGRISIMDIAKANYVASLMGAFYPTINIKP